MSARRAVVGLAAGVLGLAGLALAPATPAAAWNGLSIDGAVNSTAVADDGSIFAGGLFQNVGGEARQSLVKFNSDGSVDTAFNANIDQGQVEKVVVDDTHVYVGGQWSGVSGNSQIQVLARFDRTTGAVDNTWIPGNIFGTGLSVNDIDIVGDDVYATGSWTAFASTNRKVAKLTKTVPVADPDWGPVLTGTSNDSGATLVVDGDTLYLAGQFNFVDGESSPGLTALNTSDGSRKPGFDAAVNSNAVVSELVQVGSELYFGGQITSVHGTARNNLAAVTASAGALAAWNPAPASPENVFLSAMAADASGNIYVGGFFTSMGATPKSVSNVAALDSTSGEALDWNPMVTGGPVFGIDIDGTGSATEVYVGGIYSNIAGSQTPTDGAAAPLLSPNGNGRLNVLAGANVLIPPQATTVDLAGNTLSWTDPWLGGQQWAWVLYKRSTDPDVMRSWKVFAYGNTNGGTGQTPQTLTIDASCPSGWTCPRPIGFEGGVTYEFNVIMRSYAGKNSGGPNTARATYTPALSAQALPSTGDQSAALPAPLSGESSDPTPAPTTDPAASPTPLASPTEASPTETALVVKDVAKTVKAGRKTRLVQAGVPAQATQAKSRTTVTRASIKSRSECLVGGQKVTGKDKKRICGIKTKSKPHKVVTWAAPACNTRLKIRTTITAHTPGDQPAAWTQQWKVTRAKNSPKITCSQLATAP